MTNAQYEQFLTAKGSDTSGQSAVCTANTSYRPTEFWPVPTDELALPVGSIDWCDAFACCKWAGKRLCGKIGGGANAYADFKDATKSQWFNACSSGGRNSFPYGSTFRPEACNGFNGPHGCNSFGQPLGDCTIQPVASLTQCQATGSYAGVFDLSGNVLEWEDSCAASPDGGLPVFSRKPLGASGRYKDRNPQTGVFSITRARFSWFPPLSVGGTLVADEH